MCTTVQYFFNCGHRATHRFRNNLCKAPKSRECRIIDSEKYLTTSCKRCIAHGRGWRRVNLSRPGEAEDPKFVDTWYIPSRCFIDAGFRTLDPFGTEAQPEPLSPIHAQAPTQTPVSPTKTQSLWSQFGSKNDRGPGDGLLARIKRPKKTGPCCELEAQYGAYQSTRLEEFEDRVEGRIMDSHCESMI